MRHLILVILMAGTALFIGSVFASRSLAEVPPREAAIVEFPDQVKLLGVLLKGQYLIVHDDEKMARGENCTYLYRLRANKPDELVVSFHCQPVIREKVRRFTVSISRSLAPLDLSEIQEIQFAGSTEGHRIP